MTNDLEKLEKHRQLMIESLKQALAGDNSEAKKTLRRAKKETEKYYEKQKRKIKRSE